MHQAKLVTKKEAEKDEPGHETKNSNKNIPQEQFRYKNYLSELKINRTEPEKSELDRVRAIIDNNNLDQDRL
jgi:hypothetical protein